MTDEETELLDIEVALANAISDAFHEPPVQRSTIDQVLMGLRARGFVVARLEQS